MTDRLFPESLLRRDANKFCATCGRTRQDAFLARAFQFHPELGISESVLEPRALVFGAGDDAICFYVVRSGYIKLVGSRGSEEMVPRDTHATASEFL